MKFLVSLFGWVPVLGQVIKIAYISGRAVELVSKVKMDKSEAEKHGAEMEKIINEIASEAYEEHLKPEVDNLGLPDFATKKASEKAIDILSKKLTEKYVKKVS